ncbi:hypothetical protein VTH8203_01500 [Vibrio thalassae]|uniref:Uncharacterized protein n=1 Tax=Vibrio thalassae TaxID=1243014 RepID=A0A240EIU4_9VIBR|nr:hypothetical protein [Vibrio thalassae]SNX47885.1 hypothetical protein VTH8203_01500 [Vibrio thalassae]
MYQAYFVEIDTLGVECPLTKQVLEEKLCSRVECSFPLPNAWNEHNARHDDDGTLLGFSYDYQEFEQRYQAFLIELIGETVLDYSGWSIGIHDQIETAVCLEWTTTAGSIFIILELETST